MTPTCLAYKRYKCHRSGTPITRVYTTYECHRYVTPITLVYTDGDTDGVGHVAGESGW